MGKRILLIYGTKAGSTREVAESIGKTLREQGLVVDIESIGTDVKPTGYDGVIVGSAIRAGNWLPEVVEYVKANAETLRDLPLAYFTVCLTLNEDTPENRETVSAYLKPVREVVPARAEGFFAGKMDFSTLAFPVRMLVRAMKSPQGDFRDWKAIRLWALDVAEMFKRLPEQIPA
jgi:menaquinone-dependent protoporphyrinogen oxidase